jgi:hypothetical protein
MSTSGTMEKSRTVRHDTIQCHSFARRPSSSYQQGTTKFPMQVLLDLRHQQEATIRLHSRAMIVRPCPTMATTRMIRTKSTEGNTLPDRNDFTPEYAAEMEQKLDDLWTLHKNNPELTSVDTSHLLCNYSPAIGRSLRNNTHVTSLTLALPILFGCGFHFTLLKFI